MPRIDPIELLKCLSVLLSPNGGIKSGDEVRRLASLMTKFSKKLVSKCIYIQILKCTGTELLGLFMGSGGWKLVHIWLTESIVSKNWPLVKELLELLLLCPVDIERLKTNNCPKLVKELSKDGNHIVIRALASKLVEQWLKTVKGETVLPIHASELPSLINDIKIESNIKKEDFNEFQNEDTKENQLLSIDNIKQEDAIKKEIKDNDRDSETVPVLKISVKDGKQFISQLDDIKNKDSDKSSEKDRSSRDKSYDKSRSSKSSSRSHSSSSDKHRRSSHKSSSSSSSSKSKERSSEKDKSSSSRSDSKPEKTDSAKKSSSDKHRSSSSHKSSRHDKKESSKSKEKDKNEKSSKDGVETTNNKVNISPIQKLGKIPKLSDSKKEKPSISIEVRKPEDPKPKTVKTFHSKFRSHGLEEEVKPPPSRASLLNKKPPPPPLPPTVAIPKRPSPVHNESPPEKKAKIVEPVEKPGSIKLIPAKPKPLLLLESDMFMDALNASATNKKEPKKRKRRTSGSKDGNSTSDRSPPHSQGSGVTSPTISESKSVPPRFYQDTLDVSVEEDKDKSFERDSDPNDISESQSPNQPEEKVPEKIEVVAPPHTLTVNGLKGVLCYHKRKGPKKSIKWKPDSELEEVQYFELDETERVNVTKTFTDAKNSERVHERESFQKARNLSTDDIMEERTSWRPLILIDAEGQIAVEYGKLSKEKDIQAMKQKGTLQPLYLYKSMIPDSPYEPPVETHTYNEPTVIPLEDVTGNQDNISDFRSMPWPDPKGNAPPQAATMPMPQMFQPPIGQFPNAFPNQFPGVPPFQGPGMVPGTEWGGGVPPMMAASMPPGALPPGVLPPGMLPDNMMLTPDMFGAPNPMFPGIPPPEGFNMMDGMNMPPNMFPQDFNMMNAQGPPGAQGGGDGFNGSFRGAMRGRGGGGGGGGGGSSGSGGHWNRGKGSSTWEGSPRGRSGGGGGASRGRKQVCIYFQRRGSCRQGDNCTFLHPGVNCPF